MVLLGVFLVFLLGLGFFGYTGLAQNDPTAGETRRKGKSQVQQAGQNPIKAHLFRQGLTFLQKGDFDRAIESFNSFLGSSPQGFQAEEARFILADAYFNWAGKDLSGKSQVVLDAYQRALSRHPTSPRAPWARLRIGEVYKRLGFYYEALASLGILLDHYSPGPYHLEGRKKKAYCLLKVGRYQDAQREYQTFLSTSLSESDWVEVSLGLAETALYLGEYQKSLEAYQAVSKKAPQEIQSNPSILYLYGEALFKSRMFQEAREVLKGLIVRFPQEDFSPLAATRIGDCFLEEGDIGGALEGYGKVLLRYPDSDSAITAQVRLADIGMRHPGRKVNDKEGRYEAYVNPLAAYNEVASRYPLHPLAEVALYRRGAGLKEAKKYEEAAASFKEALNRYPHGFLKIDALGALGETLEGLIRQYYDQGKYDPLIRVYRNDVLPYLGVVVSQDTLWRVAEGYEKLELWEKAGDIYGRLAVLCREPEQKALAILRLSNTYLARGDYPAALERLQQFPLRFPKSRYFPRAQRVQGEVLFRQGKFMEAEESYHQALAAETDSVQSAEIQYLLGNCYGEMGNFRQAVESYQRVLQVAPGIGGDSSKGFIRESHFRLADALYALFRHTEAAQAYAFVIQTYPQDERRPRASYRLADCYQRSHRKEAAVKILRSLAEEEGVGAWARMAAGKLQEIGWQVRP